MKASFNTVIIAKHTGYGQASSGFTEALKRNGIDWTDNANICINFCMPPDYKLDSNISIGYTPWESTEIPNNWMEPLSNVGDIWSTSRWSAHILGSKINREVLVVPHGVEKDWKSEHHFRHPIFTFAHIGEPAIRKGGDIVLEAWEKHFKYRTDCRLIFKSVRYAMARVYNSEGSITASPTSFKNCELVTNVWDRERLKFFLASEVDCLLYPTRGEGFGLIPFEAISVGCPTILPDQGGTADFSYCGLELKNSIWVHSTDSQQHPGLWLDHSLDELIAAMEYVIENYELVAGNAFYNAYALRCEFDWDCIANKVLDRIYQLM